MTAFVCAGCGMEWDEEPKLQWLEGSQMLAHWVNVVRMCGPVRPVAQGDDTEFEHKLDQAEQALRASVKERLQKHVGVFACEKPVAQGEDRRKGERREFRRDDRRNPPAPCASCAAKDAELADYAESMERRRDEIRAKDAEIELLHQAGHDLAQSVTDLDALCDKQEKVLAQARDAIINANRGHTDQGLDAIAAIDELAKGALT